MLIQCNPKYWKVNVVWQIPKARQTINTILASNYANIQLIH